MASMNTLLCLHFVYVEKLLDETYKTSGTGLVHPKQLDLYVLKVSDSWKGFF